MEVAGKVSENIEIISSKLQDMEGAGKGSECGKVRVHRNIVKIGCKDMEGREKGPSTGRIKVHRNLKSKSAESRSIVKIG